MTEESGRAAVATHRLSVARPGVWVDLAGGISKYNDAKDVATRKLYPEYDDETGCSYVIKKSSDKLRPNSCTQLYLQLSSYLRKPNQAAHTANAEPASQRTDERARPGGRATRERPPCN